MTAYVHDCTACQYLGSGRSRALGEMHGDPDHVFDFYTCLLGSSVRDIRTFVIRYGDGPSEYMSCPLFSSEELTMLDRFALYNGLELTEPEKAKLANKLALHYRRGLQFHEIVGLGCEQSFGSGMLIRLTTTTKPSRI